MWRRTAAGRNVHIDQAEVSARIVAGQGNRVGIAYQADMREILVFIRLCQREIAGAVIWRDRG